MGHPDSSKFWILTAASRIYVKKFNHIWSDSSSLCFVLVCTNSFYGKVPDSSDVPASFKSCSFRLSLLLFFLVDIWYSMFLQLSLRIKFQTQKKLDPKIKKNYNKSIFFFNNALVIEFKLSKYFYFRLNFIIPLFFSKKGKKWWLWQGITWLWQISTENSKTLSRLIQQLILFFKHFLLEIHRRKISTF